MKKLMIMLLQLAVVAPLWAQQTQSIFQEANVIAPSPEATAMNQFIDLPVGHYTGIPNVSVPIYTLQLPQMSLPISLNYHAGGLKVGDHASWVGAGWSLSAGGSVNRTVRGLPDEHLGSTRDAGCLQNNPTIGYLRMDRLYFKADMSGIREDTIRNSPRANGISNGLAPQKDPCAVDLVDFYARGHFDTEPDQYHFSFPGGSGKFFINRDREVVKVTSDDVSIGTLPLDGLPDNSFTVFNLDTSSFIIQDAAGIGYTFSANEITNTYSLCTGESPSGDPSGGSPLLAHVSNWKLTRMSMMDNWIEFDYVTDTITYYDKYANRSFYLEGTGGSQPTNYCTSQRKVITQHLSKIRTSNGYEVEFIAESGRLDLDGGIRLSAIKVKKSGELKVHMALDNDDYFGLDEKLKLNGVRQLSVEDSTVSLPGYSFEYFTGPTDFPAIDSYQQDYWGYYNGADYNNPNMIPYMFLHDAVHLNTGNHVSREPSLEHTKMGTLSKLIYPTGGHSSFTYELNDFYDPAYRKIHTIGMAPPPANTTMSTDTFFVEETGDAEILIFGQIDGLHTWVLERESGGVWTTVTTPAAGDFNLLSGTYRFTVTDHENSPGPGYNGSGTNQGQTTTSRITFRIVSKFLQEIDKAPTGGLRIKELTFFDPLDSASIHKYFVYEDASGKTSGRQFTKEWLPGHETSYIPGHMDGPFCLSYPENVTKTINISHSSSTPVATYQGSHVGYGSVYVFNYKPCVNAPVIDGFLPSCEVAGVSQYEFHNDWSNHDQPLIPQPDLSYKNGVKEKETMYKYEMGSANWRDNLTTLQETTYEYEEITEEYKVTGSVVKVLDDSFCYTWQVGDIPGDAPIIFHYTVQPKWYRSIGQVAVQFDENGGNPMTTITDMLYDTAVTHHFPTGSEVTESTGAIIISEQQRDSYRPVLITQQEVFRMESPTAPAYQIAGERVGYNGVLPLSHSVWNRNYVSNDPISTQGYETAVVYNYDGGSLLKETRTRPIDNSSNIGRVAYLWSYGEQHVIAQVSNISYQELETALGQVSVVEGNQTYTYDFNTLAAETDRSRIAEVLSQLRTQLTDKHQQMTSYLYDGPFGMTTVIDPNGRKASYVYDGFGRLVQAKDHDGNVLSETEYNYSNQ